MANYPASLSTNANLYVAVNGLQTTLAVACTNTDTTLTLTSTTGFPATGFVTIDNTEIVSYTGVAGATITGCTRGADGTTAASHLIGVTVGLTIVAAHHNLLKDEVIAIETALGVALANVFPATPTTGTGNVVLATNPVLVTPNLGTPSAAVLTNATGLPLTSGVTGTLPNANTTATPNATASTIMSRDASINVKVNEMIENFSTTATAAGTTTLLATSSPLQQFTGTTTQTVVLPDATTLSVGFYFTILNRSTGVVTVNKNGGSLQKAIPAGAQYIFIVTSIGTSAGIWDTSSDAGTGTVTSVSGTTNQITSTGGTTPVIAIANPLTLPGPMTAGGEIAMGTSKITGLGNGTAAQDAVAYGQLHVLQSPVNSVLTTEFSTTSSTLQSTGLSATITPTSTSSKILIFVSGSAGSNNASATAFIMTIKRGSTDLAGGAVNGLYNCLGTGSTGWRFPLPLTFLDSPASVSSLTYTLYIRSSDNATACLVAVNSNESITMTLLEVA